MLTDDQKVMLAAPLPRDAVRQKPGSLRPPCDRPLRGCGTSAGTLDRETRWRRR